MRFVEAGRAGFEPAAEFKAQHSLSRRAQSASLAPPQDKQLFLAEGVGFEPTMDCSIPVFKTGALGRSAIPPYPDLLKSNLAWIGAGILPYLRMGCNTNGLLLA